MCSNYANESSRSSVRATNPTGGLENVASRRTPSVYIKHQHAAAA